MKPSTLMEVAQRAGVSTATVARVDADVPVVGAASGADRS